MPTPTPRVQLSKSGYLLLLSDVHVGAVEHAEREFDDALTWAKENDAHVFANGDIADNSVASGKDPGEKLLGQSKWPTELAEAKLAPVVWRYGFRPFGDA